MTDAMKIDYFLARPDKEAGMEQVPPNNVNTPGIQLCFFQPLNTSVAHFTAGRRWWKTFQVQQRCIAQVLHEPFKKEKTIKTTNNNTIKKRVKLWNGIIVLFVCVSKPNGTV